MQVVRIFVDNFEICDNFAFIIENQSLQNQKNRDSQTIVPVQAEHVQPHHAHNDEGQHHQNQNQVDILATTNLKVKQYPKQKQKQVQQGSARQANERVFPARQVHFGQNPGEGLSKLTQANAERNELEALENVTRVLVFLELQSYKQNHANYIQASKDNRDIIGRVEGHEVDLGDQGETHLKREQNQVLDCQE